MKKTLLRYLASAMLLAGITFSMQGHAKDCSSKALRAAWQEDSDFLRKRGMTCNEKGAQCIVSKSEDKTSYRVQLSLTRERAIELGLNPNGKRIGYYYSDYRFGFDANCNSLGVNGGFLRVNSMNDGHTASVDFDENDPIANLAK